jgi:hypothetical protein
MKFRDVNELGTVKVLMAMSFNSIIEDVFGVDQDKIELSLNLRSDLHMDTAKQEALADAIADYFDGIHPDLEKVQTLDNLFDMVVEAEFRDIPKDAFSM